MYGFAGLTRARTRRPVVTGYIGEFEQLILWSLLRLGDDAYGVTIRAEIEARTGRDVSSGSVYTALGRLEERGFVRSKLAAGSTSRGGRRRKYYALEPEGARALYDSHTVLQRMSDGLLPQLIEALG